MTREEEINKIKTLIKEYYDDGCCGIFDSRNVVGDEMYTLFKGKYIQLDICFHYSYFEVFGCDENEFDELTKYYWSLWKLGDNND